jgi:hypothetical protein
MYKYLRKQSWRRRQNRYCNVKMLRFGREFKIYNKRVLYTPSKYRNVDKMQLKYKHGQKILFKKISNSEIKL